MQEYVQYKIVLLGVSLIWLGFLLMPLRGAAQDVPVTVVIRFDEEVSFGAACVPQSTLCASARNSFTLFNDLVLPGISTQIEKAELIKQRQKSLFQLNRGDATEQAAAEQQIQQRPYVVGGGLGYEHVRLDNTIVPDLKGDIYSTQAHLLWDINDYSVGALIPYEYMDFNGFDVQRFALMGFGQYRFLVNSRTLLTYTVNADYAYAAVDAPGADNLNIFGGGLSVSLTVDQDTFVGGGAVSYQLHIDDSGRDNDHQHLIKIGANAGLRLAEYAAVTLFGIFNYDPTNYKDTVRDVDQTSLDLGLELAWSLSPTWKITGGYKKVLGLDHFDSDRIFLGTLVRF
jgi:hypothetical protein